MEAKTIVAVVELACAFGILVHAGFIGREAYRMRKIRIEIEKFNRRKTGT